MKCLVLYHSRFGQTEKIATRIAEDLKKLDVSVVIHDLSFLDLSLGVKQYDMIVVGAPLYRGQHSRLLGDFIKLHESDMKQKLTAFFSVSMAAAGDETQRAEAKKYLEEFLVKAHWEPDFKATFAGCLAYTRYGWITRMIMKWISKKQGGSTDTSKDHEYTDWKKVDAWSDTLAEAVSHVRSAAEDDDEHSWKDKVKRQQIFVG
ncbi:MAG: menaquinone-dependent protoporphyrinogen IX dehydrogenase [Pirellulaceae bacterium]